MSAEVTAWKEFALGEIFEIARGGSPRPIDDYITDDPAGINWIMIGDTDSENKFISNTKKKIKPEGALRSRSVNPGDFLLTNSMSFGRPYIMATSGCIHDGWLVLRPKMKDIYPDYFYHLLGSPKIYSEFSRLASGATVKNLNKELVKGVVVKVPPIAEQRRISKILDRADTLRAKHRETLATYNSLIDSVFAELFSGHKSTLWPAVTLGQVSEIITGYAFKSEEYVTTGDTVKLCRGANVLPGRLDWKDLAQWPTSKAIDYAEFILSPRDVLIAMDRPWISEGFKVAQVLDIDCPALLVQRVARLRSKENLNSTFLYHLLRQPPFTRHCRPTETTVPHISPKEVRSFSFSLPPIGIQNRFGEIVGLIESLRGYKNKSLVEMNGLFDAVQQRAFAGEL